MLVPFFYKMATLFRKVLILARIHAREFIVIKHCRFGRRIKALAVASEPIGEMSVIFLKSSNNRESSGGRSATQSSLVSWVAPLIVR